MVPHPLPLSLLLGTLAGGLGCFPLDHGAYPPWSYSQGTRARNSELGWVWYGHKPTLAHPVLYLLAATLRLALKLFRGEPAITRLG